MSPGEILWRLRQAAWDRIEPRLPISRVPAPRLDSVNLPPWAPPPGTTANEFLRSGERVLAGEVDLFGDWLRVGRPEVNWNVDPFNPIAVPKKYGKTIDYRDSTTVGSARAIWELNRHFQLVTLAQAWSLTGEERYQSGAARLLNSWLESCPYPVGLNWASALEHGIRLINWYMSARLLRMDGRFCLTVDGWLESIYRHCQFIWTNQSRHSSANNHLIGEMAGLYLAATAWPCWSQSVKWRQEARFILEREARVQVHEDGVTREQTVGYQIFVCQFLIIVGLVGEVSGDPFPADYWANVRRMIGFLKSIANSAGRLPDFGDSDEGVVLILAPGARQSRFQDLLDLDQLFSSSGHDGSVAGETARWLAAGFGRPAAWPERPLDTSREFVAGGYFVLGGGTDIPDDVQVVFDAAPLGYLAIAAHGHADCLSFTLSVLGTEILVDPGTYCYHSDPEWRDYFRSTAAHNTVRVDGVDQSEMGGAFMWLHKAKPCLLSRRLKGNPQNVRAAHDGYLRLPDPVGHTREVQLDSGARSLLVVDDISCRKEHAIERFWHFGADVEVGSSGATTLEISCGRVIIEMECPDAQSIELHRGAHAPRAGWLSPRFGVLIPTTTAIVRNQIAGDATLRTMMRWRSRS